MLCMDHWRVRTGDPELGKDVRCRIEHSPEDLHGVAGAQDQIPSHAAPGLCLKKARPNHLAFTQRTKGPDGAA